MQELAVARLVEEIQSDAVHDSMDLGTVLRKCKVLANEIGSPQLGDWSAFESLGYPPEEPLPSYRQWPLRLIGEFEGSFGKTKTEVIPITALPTQMRRVFTQYQCRASVAELSHLLSQSADGLIFEPADDVPYVTDKRVFRGYKCTKARVEFRTTHVAKALDAVRDRILTLTINLLVQYNQSKPPATTGTHSSRTYESNSTGLALRRTRDEQEMEDAWARVRHVRKS